MADSATWPDQLWGFSLPVISTFAGNPYFIDLETLAREGLLEDDICRQADFGNNPNQIDYGMLYQNRFHILKVAYEHAKEQQIMNSSDYVDFLNEQNEWLFRLCSLYVCKRLFSWSWLESMGGKYPSSQTRCNFALSGLTYR